MASFSNAAPQSAPGASAAVGHTAAGHTLPNSIPLSIFPMKIDKFAVYVCGLPSVGKTGIARRLARYLEFFHAVPVKYFNASEYRRRTFGLWREATMFDNSASKDKLAQISEQIFSEMEEWMESSSNAVAILDSGSLLATAAQRRLATKAMHKLGAKVLFIECWKDQSEEVQTPYKSPDYEGVSRDDADRDYRIRVEKYRAMYQEVDGDSAFGESKLSFLKCNHSKNDFVLHRVDGWLQLKIAHFLMNLRTEPHQFFLSRHGQSEYNAVGRIGGDSGLSAHGLAYAHKLAEFVEEKICHDDETGRARPARLWTSTMRRTKETAQFIKQSKLAIRDDDDPTLEHEWVQMRPRAWHHLDELFAGACDGMTYEEIEVQFPEEFERRSKDKLAYRYPRGESYLDVIARLEPIVIEMERHREPLLIVGHQGILRIIYGFYMGLSRAETPYVSIPLNVVVQLAPTPFECSAERHELYDGLVGEDGQNEPHTQRDPQSH